MSPITNFSRSCVRCANSDNNGYSSINEMLAGTDWKDPCNPDPECAACLAVRPTAPTPVVG